MPPRRSTRSASVQPVVPPPSDPKPPSKRKRGPTSEVAEVVIEQENKPPSRARRSTSAAPAAKRAASSKKKSLEKVPEDDDDDEEQEEQDTPPVKKARPSIGSEEEEEEEEEDVSKAKGTKGKKASLQKESVARASSRRSSKKVDSDDEYDEEVDIPKPPSRARTSRASSTSKTSKAKVPSSTSRVSGRSLRTLQSQPKAETQREEPDPNEVIEDSEDELLGSQRPPSKRPHVKVEMPEAASQRLSSRRPTSGRASQEPSSSKTSTRSRTHSANDDVGGTGQEGDESEPPPLRQPAKKAPTPILEDEDEELDDAVAAPVEAPSMADNAPPAEDEASLLDNPPNPQIQTAVEEESQGPKPRLVIYKMALVNFKSYAGRQEIGPFHKASQFFHVDYASAHSRYPDLEECSVEVHFRDIIDLPGPDAFETLPDSQLIVTRTAFKNNSSRYTINGRSSSYKEVQALLKGRGIDLDHNRFLILQGEVESIAQMKPKAPSEHEDGLLEYLEDIIGTSRFKEPIEGALVEMDKLNEERVEKLNRLKIVERERNALEAEKKEAEDYLRLQNDHVRALSRLWQWYIWRCFFNEDRIRKSLDALERELKDETEQNQDDITHLELLETHFEERSKAYEEVKVTAAEAVKDLQEHEKRQVGLEERRKHAKAKEKKLKKVLQDDEHALSDALRAIDENGSKIEREKAKVDQLEDELSTEETVLEQIRDSLQDKTKPFHDKIDQKQKELQPWTAKIDTKKTEIDIATSERDDLVKKAQSVKASLEEARGALEQLQADQRSKDTDIQEHQAQKNQSQRDVVDGNQKLEVMKARVQDLRSKASTSRQKSDEAKASQQASTSANKVLDSLNRLKNSGRVSGFHGRLGNLGTIPDKYDVAITTACSALNHLVVDEVDQGQTCIEYLRKQNVGRASFMVLAKLSSRGMDKVATPENVPRLFDLVKPKDPRFIPAFYKAIGNTLVADDLEQANRIAFGSARRWRVVTLAGQLIDASGTMSGGGTQASRGGMSSKLAADTVSPEVLRQYEQDSERAAQELEQAQRELRDLESQLEGLTRSLPQLDTTIQKLSLDLQNGKKRINEAQKRVELLKAQSAPDAGDLARISELDGLIAAATEELQSLEERTASIVGDINGLEEKILEIGGSRLLMQKSKVDGIRLRISLASDEITKAEVAKAKAEKDSGKLNNNIETSKASLADNQRDMEELSTQLQECSDYVVQVRSKVDAAKSAEENSKEDLDNLKAELDEKTEQIQAFRQKEMGLKQQIGDVKKEESDNSKALKHWQEQHDNLRLEEIDEDEDEEEDSAQAEADPENPIKPEPGEGIVPGSKRGTSSSELYIFKDDELSRFKQRELLADTELKNAKPNLGVLKDYRKREEEFLRRASDLDHVTQQRDERKQQYEDLTKQRLDEFMTGFNTISLKLKEMYQMITLGGNAELELVDSMDPFSEGIIFSVMPPKKSWRNISNLSGGEKTLSSLALVFALHVYKPTPLYFMDEIDAALDFRNVSIVANYIKDRTKNAQFIIISLRNDMFELSHRLIGIYKTSNATRSISIDNHALHSAPLNTVRTSL
ncbi:hypothetical protein EIP91_005335 [Steccherinum ochraceum]|uniref:Structural maintenance of chromosomes protein 4 n=1 Tax=Steccherinum ochraceum TaxID=92696 RepID=A0A4R0R7L5_9APHY|nr:hypothetical protein EIP91_005335 [Steccherinum ochraceum]